MVAIGHFGQPSVVQLQARVIRANIGENTTILVSDDHTETAYDPKIKEGPDGPDRGRRLKQRLEDVCKSEGLILVDAGPKRIGHCGGDLGPIYHGLKHAVENNIGWVAKFSQRFIVDIPGWMQKLARQMKKGIFNFNTASHACSYGDNPHFRMRTECVIIETSAWSRTEIMNLLVPKPIRITTEEYLSDVCCAVNYGTAKMFVPNWLSFDRTVSVSGVYWKDVLPYETNDLRYRELAKKYSVTLGEEFSTLPSVLLPGHLFGIGS